MYDKLVLWIGSKTCNAAGSLSDVLQTGHACSQGQALNMGVVVLSIAAAAIVIMIIAERRRQRREGYYL